MELGWTYPKRKEHLDKLAHSPSERTQLVPAFQGKNQYLKVFTVSIELPKYRLDNGRTYAAQAEYLATHPLVDKSVFEKDWESEEAQKIQHELLKTMLGKNEKELLAYFKANEQTEALIVTHDGFVINGNRRLCTMRELYYTDQVKYKSFEFINIVILPPADEKDIDALEAALQIAPDIKEEYTWYARALKYRKKRQQHNYTKEQLAKIDKVSPEEVEDLIDLLNYADAYLADRGWTDEYHRLEQTKYAFMELRKAGSKIKIAPEKLCFEKLAYCLIDGSTGGGRLYEAIPSAAKYFDQFVTRVRNDFDLTPKPIETDGAALDLFGAADESNLGDVLEVLSDPNKFEQVRDIVTDVVTAEKLKLKEIEKVTFVLSQVRKANTALLDSTAALTDHQEQKGIEDQLASIEKSIEKIRSWLK
ncbi:hypothetical protein A7981_04365 [Methylovorus sp. MM2]|uniref:hypothetical protein n=1 Tax=Methylovorus sp. MM2 TaxID=1848038 RepID=UPI0007E0BECA|nr:hypothetical protein [Methylovorus sp. MM2]OAM52692.1 hypothetical protein A7981_04365 [Methylovorus sp. MM2]